MESICAGTSNAGVADCRTGNRRAARRTTVMSLPPRCSIRVDHCIPCPRTVRRALCVRWAGPWRPGVLYGLHVRLSFNFGYRPLMSWSTQRHPLGPCVHATVTWFSSSWVTFNPPGIGGGGITNVLQTVALFALSPSYASPGVVLYAVT